MIVSHVSMCPHRTHSCDTIHIPAALSLPPYQCGDRNFDTNLNPQCKSEEKFHQFIKLKWSDDIKFEVQVSSSSSTGKEVKFFFKPKEEITLGPAVSSELLETAEALLGRGS